MDPGYLVVTARNRDYVVAKAVNYTVFVTEHDTQAVSMKLDARIALAAKRGLHTNELTYSLRVFRLLPHKA